MTYAMGIEINTKNLSVNLGSQVALPFEGGSNTPHVPKIPRARSGGCVVLSRQENQRSTSQPPLLVLHDMPPKSDLFAKAQVVGVFPFSEFRSVLARSWSGHAVLAQL